MAESPSVVIVGAGPAGDAAAFGLRKEGFEGAITLIGSDEHAPYERPYLSKQFLRDEIPLEKVFLRAPEEYGAQDIVTEFGQTAAEGSLDSGYITIGSGKRFGFDFLVLATGSAPRRLPDIPELPNVFELRTLDDAIRLKEAVHDSGRVMLLGAGFIGAEIAASSRQMGKDVLMVEMAPVPLERAIGADMGAIYAALHKTHGVDLRTGVSVNSWVVSGGKLSAVELSDGTREKVDIAVIGVGVVPNLDLPQQLALPLEGNGVAVDETLQAAPNVFVAGDIAAHLHPVYGRRLRVEHWQVAQRQGTAVASAIANGPIPYTELPWFWSDQYDVNLQYLGNAAGFDETVFRGDPAGEKFSVFYLKNGVIDAVLSINDGRTGRFSRELISKRVPAPDHVLSDLDIDLRELAKN